MRWNHVRQNFHNMKESKNWQQKHINNLYLVMNLHCQGKTSDLFFASSGKLWFAYNLIIM